ncbi:MAG: hypothetical protein IPK08_14230 [Bacteroidetes bacterium]|nr:hypothetical protein [Bacteroidota bacterium]
MKQKGKVPSDYYGVTVPTFDMNVSGSLELAMNKIVIAIEKTITSFSFKPIPSTALALGYFDNFIQPLAKRWVKQSQNYALEVMLPKNIKDIRTEVSVFRKSNPSTPVSVYEDGQRPVVHQYVAHPTLFWDIPTTLSTLYKMIDIAHPVGEVGTNSDKDAWVKYEVVNFAGTLRALIQECSACREMITIKHM